MSKKKKRRHRGGGDGGWSTVARFGSGSTAPRPPASGVAGKRGGVATDWRCKCCGYDDWSKRDACRRCGVLRLADGGNGARVANGKGSQQKAQAKSGGDGGQSAKKGYGKGSDVIAGALARHDDTQRQADELAARDKLAQLRAQLHSAEALAKLMDPGELLDAQNQILEQLRIRLQQQVV